MTIEAVELFFDDAKVIQGMISFYMPAIDGLEGTLYSQQEKDDLVVQHRTKSVIALQLIAGLSHAEAIQLIDELIDREIREEEEAIGK
ncbi:hypothetical protein [Prochlorococcus marinus]|uniref:hypothetical protein n=1 Tax=Prochlorococcus marinus TaxID=1219 RepID=UPI0022B52F36|nr:hypothetical protein [Prochlorococcus marinus]